MQDQLRHGPPDCSKDSVIANGVRRCCRKKLFWSWIYRGTSSWRKATAWFDYEVITHLWLPVQLATLKKLCKRTFHRYQYKPLHLFFKIKCCSSSESGVFSTSGGKAESEYIQLFYNCVLGEDITIIVETCA